MKKILLSIIITINLISYNVCAQDPLFTQSYNQPLYQNPALTGNTRFLRVNSSHRRQWMKKIEEVSLGTYNTSAISIDKFTPKGIGWGFTTMYDQIGYYGFNSFRVNTSLAYELILKRASTAITNSTKKNNGWRIRLGLSGGVRDLRIKGIDNLRFEDEIIYGYTEEDIQAASLVTGLVPDFTFGLISLHHFDYFLKKHPLKIWWGGAVHNLNAFNNTQNEALLSGQSTFPVKLSLQGGLEVGLSRLKNAHSNEKGGNFRIDWIYRKQGIQNQLDIGTSISTSVIGYYDYGSKNRKLRKYYSLLAGIRWRGVTFEDELNFTNDINIFTFHGGINVADEILVELSYDIPVWNLGYADLGGTVELGVVFHFGHGSVHSDLPWEKYSWKERKKFPLMRMR